MTSSVDSWNEVWDAYEARQAVAAPEPPAAPRPPMVARPRPVRGGWLRPLAAAAVFGLGCAAGSAWPVLNLYGLVLRQDVPALLQQLDLAPARDALRQGLRAQAGLHGPGEADGAERLLAGMAEEMAAALARPGMLAQLLPAPGEGAPLRLAGWGGTAVDLALPDGSGGIRLDLVWTGGGWQAAGARLLDPPAAAPDGLRGGLPLPGLRG